MKLAAEAEGTKNHEAVSKKVSYIITFSSRNTPTQRVLAGGHRMCYDYGLYTFMPSASSVRNLYVSSLFTDKEGKRNSPHHGNKSNYYLYH